jgi:hypothetical protein
MSTKLNYQIVSYVTITIKNVVLSYGLQLHYIHTCTERLYAI